MLLPHLAKHPGATLGTVATTRSLSAVNAQRTFGFEAVTTDAEEVLDAVIFRNYEYDGRGGLFPLRYPDRDQRDEELWSQLNAYLLEQE